MTVITCGDLALLGGPWGALRYHDLEHQRPTDPHCDCWREPRPEDWSGGETSPPDLPARLLEQHCDRPTAVNVLDTFDIRLCCACADDFKYVRQPSGSNYWRWLLEQCCAALALQDQRRLDSSPVAADMDIEAGYLEDWR